MLNLDCLSPEVLEFKEMLRSFSRAFPEARARSTLRSWEDQRNSNSRRIFRDLQPNLVLLALPFPKIMPRAPLPANVVLPFSVSIPCWIPGGAWRGKVRFEGNL